MSRARLAVAGAVGVALSLTGCTSSTVTATRSAASTTSPTAQSSPRTLVPLPPGSVVVLSRTLFTDPGIGGRFVPPSPKSQPRLDAGDAWAAFQRNSPGSSLIGQPFAMVLAEYSNNVQGPVPSVDTASTRAYSKPRFTWLLVWRLPESAIRWGGPVPVPGSTPPPRTYTRTDCGFEDMIDATTGHYQGAFSGCGSSLVSVAPQITLTRGAPAHIEVYCQEV